MLFEVLSAVAAIANTIGTVVNTVDRIDSDTTKPSPPPVEVINPEPVKSTDNRLPINLNININIYKDGTMIGSSNKIEDDPPIGISTNEDAIDIDI